MQLSDFFWNGRESRSSCYIHSALATVGASAVPTRRTAGKSSRFVLGPLLTLGLQRFLVTYPSPEVERPDGATDRGGPGRGHGTISRVVRSSSIGAQDSNR